MNASHPVESLKLSSPPLCSSRYCQPNNTEFGRWKTDIYSHPVPVARRLKAARENQTKANDEVARGVQRVKDNLATEATRRERQP